MRILVITAGLSALRGRANSYQESLIEVLTARGHTVHCLLTALIDSRWQAHAENEPAPWDSAARLHKIFNAGVYPALYPQGGVGTRAPRRDVVPTPWLRKTVLEIIWREQPEVISYQSLFGLPYDLIREINCMGIRTVFTMHDYFPLCPTAHLFRPDHTRCRRGAEELDCANCCRESLGYGFFWASSNLNRLAEASAQGGFKRQALYRMRNVVKRTGLLANKTPNDAEGYRMRRVAALEMLASFTVLQCISNQQAKVFLELAGNLNNLQVAPLQPSTGDKKLLERRPLRTTGTLKFGALNIASPIKGGQWLVKMAETLQKMDIECEFHIFGNSVETRLGLLNFHQHGRYQATDLDEISRKIDFCILPSIWDETLGFTGMEMLARGVPLIASSYAGISSFVKNGVDGFVYDPMQPEAFVELIASLCKNRAAAREIQSACRAVHLKTFEEHVSDMEILFKEAVALRSS